MNTAFPKSARVPSIAPNAERSKLIVESIRHASETAKEAWLARREGRAERYAELAEKARRESRAYYERSRKLADVIPFGQPILVGHHSERGHRADIKRIHGAMDKSCELSSKARYYENKADSAESNRAVFSDDPEALKKLREKLAAHEALQERMKAVNAAHKKFQKNPASLDKMDFSDAIKEKIRTYVPRYSWEPHPYPPYRLSNNNAEIGRLKKRIEQLSKLKTKPVQEDRTIEVEGVGEVTIVENADINRVQILFPGKPGEDMRKQLKSYGFRWSPSEGAWQAYRNNRTEWALGVMFPALASQQV